MDFDSEENVRTLMEKTLDDFQLESFEKGGYEQFTAKVRCKLDTDTGYDGACHAWLKKFSLLTKTNWISKMRVSNPQRFDFRKIFICQHSSANKVKNKKKGARRDYNCKAKISIKFCKVNRNTIKNNKLLAIGYNVVLDIDFSHSHSLVATQKPGMLRCSDEIKQLFSAYFESGMMPAAARTYYDMYLGESLNNGDLSQNNHNMQPSDRQVIHMYDVWRKQNGKPKHETLIEILHRKKKEFLGLNVAVIIKENPLISVIITPIMRRAFVEGLADETVYIEFGGRGDEKNSNLVFVFGVSKAGPVPVSVVYYIGQSDFTIGRLVSRVKECLEGQCKHALNPKTIISNSNSDELATEFPGSKILPCVFPAMQSLWHWLWQTNHNVQNDDRKTLMDKFHEIMYASSSEIAERLMTQLINDMVSKNYKPAKRQLEDLWQRRHEWCLSYRYESFNETTLYCELAFRIFKDVIMRKCKSLNLSALIDFIVKIFEVYHKNRLVNIAKLSGAKLDIPYDKMCYTGQKIDNLYRLDDVTFQIETEKSDLITVHSAINQCDCHSGKNGLYCLHLMETERKFGTIQDICFDLSEKERLKVAEVALGEDILEFFCTQLVESGECDIQTENIPYSIFKKIEVQRSGQKVTSNNGIQKKYKIIVEKMKAEFARISDIIEEDANIINLAVLNKFVSIMEKVKTTEEAADFIRKNSSLPKLKTLRNSIRQPMKRKRTDKESEAADMVNKITTDSKENLEISCMKYVPMDWPKREKE